MGAAAGLLLSRFPLRPITSKALESQGGFETIGFKRRFCILFVAVDKKHAAGGKQETTAGKSGPPEARFLYKKSIERKLPVGDNKARRIMTAEGYHHRDSLSFPGDRPTRTFT